jgi:uncharacterized protein
MGIGVALADSHMNEVERWRAERVAVLTAADGWLTLVGLHFLKPGTNTVGSAQGNNVVLGKGPARVGTVMLADDGGMTFVVEPGVTVRVDGVAASRAVLSLGGGSTKPTTVTFGTMSFFAVDRAGKKALRVKDSEAESRTRFQGLDYFPIAPEWKIEARWVPFEKSRRMPVANMLGHTDLELIPGRAIFERDGKTFELLPIDEGLDRPLFFVISDATSGKQTYGASRFLYVERPKAGETRIVLDFNRAENPPCVFTSFAACPLPPKENRLPFAVNAGEKTYRGGHE